MRFHLDENIATAIAEGLRRRGIDVTTTVEANLIGATDASHLEYAIRDQRVIVTQDTDFLRATATSRTHCGIVFITRSNHSFGDIIRHLLLINDSMSESEMYGSVEFF